MSPYQREEPTDVRPRLLHDRPRFAIVLSALVPFLAAGRFGKGQDAGFQVFDAVTDKLLRDRSKYSYQSFSSVELFPNSGALHQGENAWKQYFNEVTGPQPISGKTLSLTGTSAQKGDIVLLERADGSRPLVLVYVGDNRFPGDSRAYSFFVFPYSPKGGLELNTMPPRWTRQLLEQYGMATEKLTFATAANQHGLTIDWLQKPNVDRSLFLRSSWWKPGTNYRVLRAGAATATANYVLGDDVALAPEIEADVKRIADAYFKATKKKITVTSGTRSPSSQARAMYEKLAGGDQLADYKDQASAKEIKDEYNAGKLAKRSKDDVISRMTAVIEQQIQRGIHISKHLQAGAVDIRSTDMGEAERTAFRKAAEQIATTVILETTPPHWHLQF